MARAHLYRPITNSNGDVLLNTAVRVLQPDVTPSLAPVVAATVWGSKTGTDLLGTTFVAENGVIDLWLDDAQFVTLGLTPPGKNEYFIPNVPVVGPQGPKGDKGDPGAKGGTGAQGVAGVQGPQGIPGLKGDQGDQGLPGATGARGATGAQGVKGDTGNTGADAYAVAVANGYVGTQVQWIASLKGATGAQGPKGDVGATGAQGAQGLPGAVGATGAQGPQGVQGIQGDVGATGARGATGATGVAGPTGATGAQGLKGDQGLPGAVGATGATGAQGIQGIKGDQGIQGLPGAVGATGAQGPQGVQGVKGDIGATGATGPAGSNATATTDASKLTTGTLSTARLPVVPSDKIPDLSDKYVQGYFDMAKTAPEYMTSIELAAPNVMQSAVKEPISGFFYSSQSIGGSPESAWISQVAIDGTLLSHMVLTNCGHATVIAVQVISGKTYIWMCWSEAVAGGQPNDLVRFEYRAGATLKRSDTSYFTVINKFGNDYVLAALDEVNDYIAYRISDGTTEIWQRRKLSEVMAGVDKIYGQIGPVPQAPPTMQGFCMVGDDLYRLTGAANAALGEQSYIWRYSFVTGLQTGKFDITTVGMAPDNTPEDGAREPEGISLYRDPRAGNYPSIIFGVSVRRSGSRKHRIYIYRHPQATNHIGDMLVTMENLMPVEKDGSARRMMSGTTSMVQIDKPGWWYLTAAEYATMTDRPTDWANSGHFLLVSGSDTVAGRTQRLTRNTTSATFAEWTRVVDTSTGEKTNWQRVTLSSIAYIP